MCYLARTAKEKLQYFCSLFCKKKEEVKNEVKIVNSDGTEDEIRKYHVIADIFGIKSDSQLFCRLLLWLISGQRRRGAAQWAPQEEEKVNFGKCNEVSILRLMIASIFLFSILVLFFLYLLTRAIAWLQTELYDTRIFSQDVCTKDEAEAGGEFLQNECSDCVLDSGIDESCAKVWHIFIFIL